MRQDGEATSETSAHPFPSAGQVPPRRRAGRWVVMALLTFGAVLTGINWLYWKWHVSPFLPLQKKLADTWPDSRPRVEGGHRKMHKDTPKILRVTMKIDFDPRTQSGQERAKQFAERVAAFVTEHVQSLSDYEYLELHFYWPEPEKKIHEVSITFDVSTLID